MKELCLEVEEMGLFWTNNPQKNISSRKVNKTGFLNQADIENYLSNLSKTLRRSR